MRAEPQHQKNQSTSNTEGRKPNNRLPGTSGFLLNIRNASSMTADHGITGTAGFSQFLVDFV